MRVGVVVVGGGGARCVCVCGGEEVMGLALMIRIVSSQTWALRCDHSIRPVTLNLSVR